MKDTLSHLINTSKYVFCQIVLKQERGRGHTNPMANNHSGQI